MQNRMNRKNHKSSTRPDAERTKAQYLLPCGFEQPDEALTFRKDTRTGLRQLPKATRRPLLIGPCTRATRCKKGTCPICARRQRKALVRFAEDHQLHELDWLYLTVRIEPWVMNAGDYQRFTDFVGQPNRPIRTIQPVKNLLARLKRQSEKDAEGNREIQPLLIIGSMETLYKVVANQPRGKPFHLHLLISGIRKGDIKRHAEALFGKKVDGGPVRPVDVRDVNTTPKDFVRVLTYCLKQPFKKEVFINDETKRGRQVWGKPNELAELACNLGPISLSDRLILVGIRYENEIFRMLRRIRGMSDK